MSQTYCQLCNGLPDDTDNPNKAYHEREYGHPLTDDNALFERLVLEINQAGLNWTMMLQKREAFAKPTQDSTLPPWPHSANTMWRVCWPTAELSATA